MTSVGIGPYSGCTSRLATESPEGTELPVASTTIPQHLTVEKAAERCSVSVHTMREWIDRGIVRVVQVLPGGRRLIAEPDSLLAGLLAALRSFALGY